MKRILSIAILVLFVSTLAAQAPAKYWVHFKDKANSAYSIERPEEFLSPRALAKRARFNIAIDQSDLPVNQNYIDQLLKIDTNMVLLTKSKWLNGVTVYSTTENIEKEIEKLPFVSYCECTAILKEEEKFDYPKFEYTPSKKTKEVVKYAKDGTLPYGYATLQVSANRAHWLHKLGAHGEGMIIAVLTPDLKMRMRSPTSRHCAKRAGCWALAVLYFPDAPFSSPDRTERKCFPASRLTSRMR